MSYKKTEQKFISFTNNNADIKRICEDMNNGWSIVSLTQNGSYYIGIMENTGDNTQQKDSIYIPPRKKIKISSG